MDDRRFIELQAELNREFGRRDRLLIAYHKFRLWLDEVKERWNIDNPLLQRST